MHIKKGEIGMGIAGFAYFMQTPRTVEDLIVPHAIERERAFERSWKPSGWRSATMRSSSRICWRIAVF